MYVETNINRDKKDKIDRCGGKNDTQSSNIVGAQRVE
jgi:hypothetical protein